MASCRLYCWMPVCVFVCGILLEAEKVFHCSVHCLQAEYALNPTGSSEARRSPYAGCVFPLSITFKASYPMTPPKVGVFATVTAAVTRWLYAWLTPLVWIYARVLVPSTQVKFEVPVYHPQVVLKGESIGQMCADFVSGGWTPKMTVRDVLEKVLQLLASPEPGRNDLGATNVSHAIVVLV